MSRNDDWERVLALVQAEADYAEALLAVPASAPVPEQLLIPPSVLPARAELPAPAAMPPVPDDLRDRITALRDRIDDLQGLLAAALGNAPWQLFTSAAPPPPSIPRFLDTRV